MIIKNRIDNLDCLKYLIINLHNYLFYFHCITCNLWTYLISCFRYFLTYLFYFHFSLDMVEFDIEFVEEVVLSLSRLDSSSIALAAFKMHKKWILEEKIKPFNPKFGT